MDLWSYFVFPKYLVTFTSHNSFSTMRIVRNKSVQISSRKIVFTGFTVNKPKYRHYKHFTTKNINRKWA